MVMKRPYLWRWWENDTKVGRWRRTDIFSTLFSFYIYRQLVVGCRSWNFIVIIRTAVGFLFLYASIWFFCNTLCKWRLGDVDLWEHIHCDAMFDGVFKASHVLLGIAFKGGRLQLSTHTVQRKWKDRSFKKASCQPKVGWRFDHQLGQKHLFSQCQSKNSVFGTSAPPLQKRRVDQARRQLASAFPRWWFSWDSKSVEICSGIEQFILSFRVQVRVWTGHKPKTARVF